MKRTTVYLLILTVLMAALLTGCGEYRPNDPGTSPTPSATAAPSASMMPDPSDGVVDDTDGSLEPETPDGREAKRTERRAVG